MPTTFEQEWKTVAHAISGQEAARQGEAYVGRVREALEETIENINLVGANAKSIDYTKGDIAEPWHAGTLNVDAVRKGIRDVWAVALRNTSPVDVRVHHGGHVTDVQIKYWKTPERTAKEISDPDYVGMGKVVPSDQLEGVRAEAERLASRNAMIRPDVSGSYRDTAASADDRIRSGNAESHPLEHETARRMAKDLKRDGEIDPQKYGLTPEAWTEWSGILREAGAAGARAAVLGAAVGVAAHLVEATRRLIEDGSLDLEELRKAGISGLAGAARGGLGGALTAGVVAACHSGKIAGGALANVHPSVVSAAVVLAIITIRLGIQAAHGDITWRQMAQETTKATVLVCGATAGGAIGQAVIPVPILGAAIGSIVGSVATALVYQGANSACVALFQESVRIPVIVNAPFGSS